ncbi:NAD(P)H azoreductase [Streptomyces sp. YIM 130001]|uniref:NAD(P)H-binding protein n=1 Tax=Streptomyces sp. YIM 130001 TaxID=2259644 RepID=UPI000E648F41|nr:NAD(P)H-binding protein [Streptomyces sp. YIM 130001]RII13776.1 NAD(P)H azoreductase [Streptomyces sp. YIM 130001]
MILVTGATGTIGSEVVRLLAARGEQVRALTRDPARAKLPAGVDVVRGDFDDPVSLERAAAGATALFLLSAPGPSVSLHDRAMLAPARAAGTRRVVKLSAIGTDEPGGARVGAWHAPGEAAVQGSGMAWTLLRPSSFASNAVTWAGALRAGAPIPNLTGAGKQGVVDPRDVAAVAVEALTSAGHADRAYTLTGPELLSVPDQAVRLGDVLGRAVETVDVPLDVARQQLVDSGMDAAFADGVMDGSEFVRGGGGAVLTGEVEDVLGRPPGGFDAWVRDHRDVFGV